MSLEADKGQEINSPQNLHKEHSCADTVMFFLFKTHFWFLSSGAER